MFIIESKVAYTEQVVVPKNNSLPLRMIRGNRAKYRLHMMGVCPVVPNVPTDCDRKAQSQTSIEGSIWPY